MPLYMMTVPADRAKACLDPSGAQNQITSRGDLHWATFLSDATRPPNEIDVSNEACLFFGEDRDTAIASFRAAGDGCLKAEGGTMLLAQGSYGTMSGKRVVKSAALAMPSLAKALADYGSKRNAQKNPRAVAMSFTKEEATDIFARNILVNRGYFILAMSRALLSGDVPKGVATYMAASAFRYGAVATMLRHGKDV